MASIIDRLLAHQNGEAPFDGTGLPCRDGRLDISGDNWRGRSENLLDLHLERITLRRTEVSSSFMNCSFENSLFEKLYSEDEFIGRGCVFRGCRFEDVKLRRPWMGSTTFEACHFVGLRLVEFSPYQTYFKACTFEDLEVDNLSPDPAYRFDFNNPQLMGRRTALVFEGCQFSRARFRSSRLAKVAFDNCQMDLAEAHLLSFDDMESGRELFPIKSATEADRIDGYIQAVIRTIKEIVGKDSVSAAILERERLRARNGDLDPFELLGREALDDIPESEYRRFEAAVDRIPPP